MKTPAAMRYKTTNTKNSFITIVATAGIQSKNLNANAVSNGISNMRRMVLNIFVVNHIIFGTCRKFSIIAKNSVLTFCLLLCNIYILFIIDNP